MHCHLNKVKTKSAGAKKLLILKILLFKKGRKFKSLLDKVYPGLFRATNVKEYELVVGMEGSQKFEQAAIVSRTTNFNHQ